MKIDFDVKLKDPMDKEFSDGATVKAAAYAALSSQIQEDQMMSMDQKLKLYRLTQKIAPGGVIDLPAEDIATIKTRAAKVLPLIGFGALCDALETKAQVVELPAAEQDKKVG
jgi:hypothetical protein